MNINNIKSRKGSYLVEAALILPLIIIITIMMMCVSMYTYMNTACAAKMDKEVRKQAGENSETVFFIRNDTGIKDNDDSFADKYETDRSVYSGLYVVTAHRNAGFVSGVKWIDDRKNTVSVQSSEISECREIWVEMY